MKNRKLRIGLLLEGRDLAAWEHRMVELIKRSEFAELVVAVRDASSGRALARRVGAIDAALSFMEQRLVGKPGFLPDASARVDASALLTGVEVIEASAGREDGGDLVDGDALACLRDRNIDVLIATGSVALRGGILGCARHGVWACRFGGGDAERGLPVGYREVMESRPEMVSFVQMHAEGRPDGGEVLYRSVAATIDMSLADNRSSAQWKSLHFIPRLLAGLHRDGEEAFFRRARRAYALPAFDDGGLSGPLPIVERCGLIARKLAQKVGRKWNELFRVDQWLLQYAIGDGISTSFGSFRSIEPPRDRSWADPFVVARDGRYYTFIEEIVDGDAKGHISVIVMEGDGRWGPPVRVLERPYHLSYPFVFEFDHAWYMIPESYDNGTVELYRCVAFPDKWEFVRNLMEDCKSVDNTLFEWDHRWWMFSSRVETEGASTCDELFVHWSDSPLSDRWTAHPCNPVISDARTARPAGRVFACGGRLFRPSQTCVPYYGRGFNICEITNLTETEYEEHVVTTVVPRWHRELISTHTFNHDGGLTIIDVGRRRIKT